jgi:hypothetical protein
MPLKAYVRFEPSRFTQPFDIQHHIVISSPLCVFLESKLNVQANMIGLEMVNRTQNQSNLNRRAVSPANDSCGNGLAYIGK